MASRFGWIWAVLLSIPAGWPLLGASYFAADDSISHLMRVPGLDTALQQGILYPRVFANYAYGYSYPLFGYYGPVGYYAAEFIHLLGANFPDAVRLMYALGYTFSGLFAYLLARRYVSTAPALLGATAYIYFPYHLAETYQRGAYAEHLAWIWMPLALLPLTPNFAAGGNGGAGAYRLRALHAALAAGALALLIMTHSLMAFVFLPVCALYFWIVTPGALVERLRYGGLIAFGALGLSAFSWLPLLTESRWVWVSQALERTQHLSLAPLAQWIEFTPIFQHGQNGGGEPIHPLGLISALALLAAIVALVYRYRAKTSVRALAFFIGVTLISWGMTGDVSSGLWVQFAFPLVYLQYAWRVMTVTGLGSAIAMALTFQNLPKLSLLLIPVVLISGLADIRYTPVDITNTDEFSIWRYDLKITHLGTTYNDEYLPLWVGTAPQEVSQPINYPRSDAVPASPHLTLLESSYQHARFRVDSSVPARFVLHQFYLPQWRANLSDAPIPVYPSGKLGLVTVDIPATQAGLLDLDFVQTDLEQLEWWTALVTAAALLLLARDWRLLAAVLCAFGFYGFLVAIHQQPPQTVTQVGARLEDGVELMAVSTPANGWLAGSSIPISIYWQALRETNESLKAFVHLVDKQTGKVLAQSDSVPGPAFSPTSRWAVGEMVPDRRVLTIPADTPPGRVQLYIGLYRGLPPHNLEAVKDEQTVPGGRILAGEYEVVGK